MRGCRREKVANILITQRKDAVTFRREEAKRLKIFGTNNMPTVPNAAVLRKAKEQQLLKVHGLEFASPPMNLLHQSQYGKYAGSIHSIGLLKFHCIYWSPEQQQIYAARCKMDPNAIMTIDATGSVAEKSTKEEPHVFLYQCMLVTKEGSVPVFQMVSVDQRSFQIAHFLRFILAKGLPRPPIVVCDFGRALVNAIAEIFRKCSDLPDYLLKCYNAVVNGSLVLPASNIRLDVSHLIAMVSRWPCLRTKVPVVGRLYKRCIAQAYQMADFPALANFLQSILVVALSEFIGNAVNGEAVPAETRMQYLNKVIQGVTVDDIIVPMEENEDDYDGEDETPVMSDWHKWSEGMFKTAEDLASQSLNGNIINACYNPEFATRLKKQLLPYLPLWTGIMRSPFGIGAIIATSASVEAEFADLKTRALKHELPMRIDKFVFQHLSHLDGKVKLASNVGDVIPNYSNNSENHEEIQSSRNGSQVIEEISTAEHASSSGHVKVQETDLANSNNGIKTPSPAEHTGKQITNASLALTEDYLVVDPFTNNDFHSSTVNDCDLWNSYEDWRGKAAIESKNADSIDFPPKKRLNLRI